MNKKFVLERLDRELEHLEKRIIDLKGKLRLKRNKLSKLEKDNLIKDIKHYDSRIYEVLKLIEIFKKLN